MSSPATDVWALGGVLYYAVEGKPPFDKGQPIPTLTAVLHDEPEIDPEATGVLTPAISAALEQGSRSTALDRRTPCFAAGRAG